MMDLVITVLIIGILAAVAVPKYAKTLNRLRAEAAAKRIKADLGYARQSAISGSSAIMVQFTVSADSYLIPGLADLNHSSQPYSVNLSITPYDAAIVSATLGGDSDVQFDRFGKPDSGGTIVVESGGHQRTVTIDPDTGRASL